jgi:hypothetical protein
MEIDDKIAEELKNKIIDLFFHPNYGGRNQATPGSNYHCAFCGGRSDSNNFLMNHDKYCRGKVFAEALGEHFPYHPDGQ